MLPSTAQAYLVGRNEQYQLSHPLPSAFTVPHVGTDGIPSPTPAAPSPFPLTSLPDANVPAALKAQGIVSAGVGRSHTILVTEAGEAWSAGLNTLGQVRVSLFGGDGTALRRKLILEFCCTVRPPQHRARRKLHTGRRSAFERKGCSRVRRHHVLALPHRDWQGLRRRIRREGPARQRKGRSLSACVRATKLNLPAPARQESTLRRPRSSSPSSPTRSSSVARSRTRRLCRSRAGNSTASRSTATATATPGASEVRAPFAAL